MPLLFPTHRFRYSYRFSSKGKGFNEFNPMNQRFFLSKSYLLISCYQDDRYFLSGSLDGKLRLWNIPDKKVALWNELDGQTKLITAANFCQVCPFSSFPGSIKQIGRITVLLSNLISSGWSTEREIRCGWLLRRPMCILHYRASEILHTDPCQIDSWSQLQRSQDYGYRITS